MTENNEKNPEKKRPAAQNRKWLLISLCSVALLAGVVGYGVYNNHPTDEASPAHKTEQKQNATSDKTKKELPDAWEKQVAPKKQKKKTAKNETEKNKTIDDILSVILGEKKEGTFFGISLPSESDKKGLVEKLAIALDEQTQKEEKRQKDEVVHAAEIDSKSSKEPALLLKDQILERGFIAEGIPEKNVTNPLPDAAPISTATPLPAQATDTSTETTPAVTPEATPTAPVDDSINKLANKSRVELFSATVQAVQINTKLAKVKAELDTLQHIDQTTQSKTEKGAYQWDVVKNLISEYDQLSDQLKQLTSNGENTAGVNLDLYNDTYDQLSQKVSAIKEAQNSANETTDGMNADIEKAESTLNSIEAKKSEYKIMQDDVTNAIQKATTAVSNAEQNIQVAAVVQPAIDKANEATTTVNNTNASVGDQLKQAGSDEAKITLDTAKQTASLVTEQANEQNSMVSTVTDEFSNVQTPEALNNQNESETPADNQVAPTDQSVNAQTSAVIENNTDTNTTNSTQTNEQVPT